MKKKYSLIPHDTIHTVKDLTDEEAGQLFKKILYYFNGEDLEVDRIPDLMFQTLKPKFDEHNESYKKQLERKSIANRENGKKGGRPKKTQDNPVKPKETQINPNKPKITQNNPSVIKDDRFNEFWECYGKKVDRKKCETKWNTLNQSEITKILATLPEYVKANNDIQFRKNPLTYLNGQCWEDDIIKQEVKKTNTFNQQPNTTNQSNVSRVLSMQDELLQKLKDRYE